MTKFRDMQRTNKIIVVFIGLYIITAFFFLMYYSKEIETGLLIGGFSAVTGIFTAILAFIKYQSNKRK